MTYGYSDDLRTAALSYYDRENVTQHAVSEIFGISLKTVSNWIRLRKDGNFSRRSCAKVGTAYRLDEDALKRYSIS